MKKILIGGVEYIHSFSSDSRTVSEDKTNGTLLWGLTDMFDCTIRQVDTPIKGIINKTFYHELIHAIINEYRIRGLQDNEGKHNEDEVDLIAQGLAQSLGSLGINIEKVLKGIK